MILKVDKGGAIVVTKAKEYNDKINCLLSDSSVCSKLSKKSNSMFRITSNFNKYVWNLFKTKKISEAEYHSLHSFKDVIPRFYRLPKIQKVPLSLRLFVSFHHFQKFLSLILSSQVLINRCSVRNFKKFVDYNQNFTVLISFDVVHLYTSVPMDKILCLVLDLSSDGSWLYVLFLISLT